MAQPVSAAAFHCYAGDGAQFDSQVASRALSVEGVRSAHLVTAGRLPGQWCLVLEPDLVVEQNNAVQLHRLVEGVGRQIGLTRLQLLRPVERRDGGPAIDLVDWLRW